MPDVPDIPNTSDILLKVEDVAEAVGVAASTIRKYSVLIEKYGYRFKRNHQGALIFRDFEVGMFRTLIQLKSQKNMTLEKAIKQLLANIPTMSDISNTSDTSPTDIANIFDIVEISTDIADMRAQMGEFMSEVMKQNKELIEKVDRLENLNKKQIEDRDKLLMESIRETQELKKLILESRQKKWWQFWK
jgi:hypothetical protein